MAEKKPKDKVLFSDIEIEGYKIKPWSLGKMEELSPCFERIGMEFIKRGLKIANVEKEIPQIIFTILPQVSIIISITLNEDIEKVKEFDIGKATTIIIAIARLNMEFLKNVSSPVMGAISQIVKTS